MIKPKSDLISLLSIIVVILFLIWLYSPSIYQPVNINPNYITHTYFISENKELIVNNYDCGATCNFNTTVYLEEINQQKKITNKILFSCEHINDIELGEITYSSAKIIKINGLTQDVPFSCKYKIGDILNF